MTSRFEAVEKVFGMPDTFTVRPTTYGEMNPVLEMPTCKHNIVGDCEACAHSDYFCEHGVFGFEPCQPCETIYAALAFGCQIMGHDMVDNGSYAGPDSGFESMVCTHCGFEFEHTYY